MSRSISALGVVAVVPQGERFRALESMRGLAAIVICLYHSNFSDSEESLFISNSGVFVDFFFILSGFVMAFAYLDKIKSGLAFTQFVLLRIGRLYPMHVFALALWIPYILFKGYLYYRLGVGGVDPFVQNSLATFFSNLVLVNGLGLHNDLSWNYVAWTVSVELFTYFSFFGLVAVLARSYKPWHALAVSAVGYSILCAAADGTLLKTFDLGFFRGMGGFFFGVYLYSVFQALSRAFHRCDVSARMASAIELLMVSMIVAVVLLSSRSKAHELLAFLIFGLAILVFAVSQRGLVTQLLSMKPFVWVGTLSYSIYLLHPMIINVGALNFWEFVLRLPVSQRMSYGATKMVVYSPYSPLINLFLVVVIFGVSYLTYSLIERPWRDRFRLWAQAGNTTKLHPT